MIIIQDTLENNQSTIRGRLISNLRFADDIDLLAGSESELQAQTDSLEDKILHYMVWK